MVDKEGLSITGASVTLSAPKITLSAQTEMALTNSAGSGITLCRDIHVKPKERAFLEGTVHETFSAIPEELQKSRVKWNVNIYAMKTV